MNMIDVFLRSNTLIPDIRKALGGLDCNCVLVRNGGPTEIWQRMADGWERDTTPGMTFFEDLLPSYLYFSAFRSEAGGVGNHQVDEVMSLPLSCDEAREWLASMDPHRYALEDALACTVSVAGVENACVVALFSMAEFKSMTRPSTLLAQKILEWVDRALAAGADRICAVISFRNRGHSSGGR